MVRSCALLFSWKKITFFWKCFFPYCKCCKFKKKVEKSCDARFFGAKTVLRIFWGFLKKVGKIAFFAFFSEKCLWSRVHFHQKSCYHSSSDTWFFWSEKKCQKKRVFVFWNSFLKMKIGHLFLSIFEFKKKVLKTLKLSIFSISPKYFDKNLSKDPRKVQFLFSNERKLISRFSRIFWYFSI